MCSKNKFNACKNGVCHDDEYYLGNQTSGEHLLAVVCYFGEVLAVVCYFGEVAVTGGEPFDRPVIC